MNESFEALRYKALLKEADVFIRDLLDYTGDYEQYFVATGRGLIHDSERVSALRRRVEWWKQSCDELVLHKKQTDTCN